MNPNPHARAAPATIRSALVIGIDVGQQNDPTAIAVVEASVRAVIDHEEGRARNESHFFVRFLERMPLGTPYPHVAQRLGEIWLRVGQRANRPARVFVDATGVGKPVVDALRAQLPLAEIWAVNFTRGQHRNENRRARKVTLGKAFLVNRLQVLLQDGRLHLPKGSEARALAVELLTYEIRVDENAVDRYGAFRVGTHDDLVTALGLAIQDEPDHGG